MNSNRETHICWETVRRREMFPIRDDVADDTRARVDVDVAHESIGCDINCVFAAEELARYVEVLHKRAVEFVLRIAEVVRHDKRKVLRRA